MAPLYRIRNCTLRMLCPEHTMPNQMTTEDSLINDVVVVQSPLGNCSLEPMLFPYLTIGNRIHERLVKLLFVYAHKSNSILLDRTCFIICKNVISPIDCRSCVVQCCKFNLSHLFTSFVILGFLCAFLLILMNHLP